MVLFFNFPKMKHHNKDTFKIGPHNILKTFDQILLPTTYISQGWKYGDNMERWDMNYETIRKWLCARLCKHFKEGKMNMCFSNSVLHYRSVCVCVCVCVCKCGVCAFMDISLLSTPRLLHLTHSCLLIPHPSWGTPTMVFPQYSFRTFSGVFNMFYCNSFYIYFPN